MVHSPPLPSFFALRVELRVGLEAEASASTGARFLFGHREARPSVVASERVIVVREKKHRVVFTFGGISALLGRMRWQVNNPSMSKKRDNAWLVLVVHEGRATRGAQAVGYHDGPALPARPVARDRM